jgi:ATP-dependent helicase/nuclease subunit A
MHDFDYHTALNPGRSVVIEACAGSGKTWLLVSRILRLLLAGAEPGEILAITFTRKAAQEMQARLLEWLRLLALQPEDEAREFLRQRALPDMEVDALLPRARNLLERVLTATPALTINTFHGWFLQLLQKAPLEGGAVSNFSLLDQTSALLEEAWQSFAEDMAVQQAGDTTASALRELFRDHGLFNTRALLLGFVAKRAEWWAYTAGQADPLGYALERLRLELEVDPARDVLAERQQDTVLAGWHAEYAQLLEKNTATDQKLAARLVDALALNDLAQRFEALWQVYFTQAGTPRVRSASPAQAKRLGANGEARLIELHQMVCSLLRETRDCLTAQAAYRFNCIGLRCGAALLDAYQRLKDARQMLDFTDVEWRAFQLLSRSDYAEYMQYKLDSRYSHILLDEFQDTNPLQWQVVQSWLGAYDAAGSRPSVFLVGDPKQSIYRFRRAEPRLFQIAAASLMRDFAAARLEQDTSRRSAPAVIQAVNRVFAAQPAFDGFRAHGWHHDAQEGAIVLLPLAEGSADPHPSPLPEGEGVNALLLRNPLEKPLQEDEDVRHDREAAKLAEKITAIVGHWQVDDEKLGPRPAAYRDIMLLVRSRTWLATYERALRAARIPYLSSRQGGLLDTLECSDLVALLEFLVTPFADLKLAQVLRSPLFGCDDTDLMLLAHGEESSWWQRLKALPEELLTQPLKLARERLASWQEIADRLPVHDLLDRIYFEGEVLQRYGMAVPQAMIAAVQANLHAFIELALNMDSGRYPSLAHFIDEVAALRRAPEQESPDEGLIGDGSDALRILTVHGAKGLEAPIVWLLDANAAPRNESGYRILVDWPPEAVAPRHFSLLSRKAELDRAREHYVEAEAAHARRENLNLLYVAMTRAKQALIVSGCASGKAGDSWYQKIQAGLQDAGLDFALSPAAAAPGANMAAERVRRVQDRLPVPPTGRRDASRRNAARRHGIQLHALLEGLDTGRSLAEQKEALQLRLGLDDPAFELLWAEAVELLQAPRLRRFFDPELHLSAYNELSYQGGNGETRRIDRLVEFADSVWILDYKTTASKDADYSMLAAVYRPQMQDYQKAMASVFPGKSIRCALIFPGATLIEV